MIDADEKAQSFVFSVLAVCFCPRRNGQFDGGLSFNMAGVAWRPSCYLSSIQGQILPLANF